MLVLAGIVLVMATVAFVMGPFALRLSAPLTDGTDQVSELRELYALRDLHYETLRDIEFDFHAGKITQRDHDEMTDRYTREAVGVAQRIEALEAALRDAGGRRPHRR
jgi:hypothetical protein